MVMEPHERRALRQLRALAKKTRTVVTVDVVGIERECRVTAPHSYIFGNEGLHEFVAACYTPWHPDYSDLLERLRSSPPIPCEDAECEWCHPELYE